MALTWIKVPDPEVQAEIEALYARAPERVRAVEVWVKVKPGSLGNYQWEWDRRRIVWAKWDTIQV